MRKSASSDPQRRSSFPSKRKGVFKDSRKVRPKVSFSVHPPTKITFESDGDSSDEQEVQNVKFNSRGSQILNENDIPRSIKYRQCVPNQEAAALITDTPERVNPLDCANEMLMDIIEEIEADNISIDGCLRDAITLNVINLEEARSVLDNFEFEITKSGKDANNNFSSSTHGVNRTDCEVDLSNTPTNKLLDLLSTLKTDDLTKCCRYTLGKLCQLTSFEDYETVQKNAANAQQQLSHYVISRIPSDEYSTTSEIPDDSSSTDTIGITSSSSDTFDDSSGLGSEIDFQCGTRLNSTLEPQRSSNCNAAAAALKQALPTLIEGGVLRPIQVWGIIGSKDNEELLTKFSHEISLSLKNSRIPASPNHKPARTSSFQRKFDDLSDNSIVDQGYCSYQSELDSPTSVKIPHSGKDMNSTSNVIKKRPFTITSARSNSLKFNLRSSMPIVNQNHWRTGRRTSENDSLTCKDYAALISWCEKNELPTRTAYILHCNGCYSENDLLELNIDNARYIQDLSWNTKTRLVIAIESLRLERYYADMKSKLERCTSVLRSTPP